MTPTQNGVAVPARAATASQPSQQAVSGIAGIANASLVEQIACGLFLAEHPNAEWHGGRARAIWFNRAYAALEAMREPTADMLQGACEKHTPGLPMSATTPSWRGPEYDSPDECPRFDTRRRIWQKMIDAALAWPTSDDVAKAMSARQSQDPQGLGPQDASAVPAGNLP
jgi:hypothetical protein